MNNFKAFVCVFYGLISIAQTLNSRFLFRTLQFNFYSVVFMTQRIFIVFLNHRMGRKTSLSKGQLVYVLPYAFIMCSINILSSYCVTVMPLAAFMAFKKFVVFFVLITGLIMRLPNNFHRKHYLCIAFILMGGLMIGEKDIFAGEFIGYLASLVYTLFEALSLQFALHLYEKKIYGPQDLMVANSILSLPYYIILIYWEQEYQGLFSYFSKSLNPLLFPSLVLAILLAFASEYTGMMLDMQPIQQKASVSNIKDLILTVISIEYFKDLQITLFSEVGLALCLSASVVFSFTLIEQAQQKKAKPVVYKQFGDEVIEYPIYSQDDLQQKNINEID